jgi:LysR family hydrogen peroxide-inducible transcriptional activator
LEFREFSDPVPVRKVVIAWRASFPRPQAIDVLRAAILDAPPPGVLAG